MRVFHVEVTQLIEVSLDDTKFDDTFMREFRDSFYDFDTLEDHAMHIAQMQARGLIDLEWSGTTFVEGYGPANEMGLSAKEVGSAETEIVRHHPQGGL